MIDLENRNTAVKQLLLNIQPPAAPGFDNFITGQNQEALASLQAVLAGQSTTRFVYLWGGVWQRKKSFTARSAVYRCAYCR